MNPKCREIKKKIILSYFKCSSCFYSFQCLDFELSSELFECFNNNTGNYFFFRNKNTRSGSSEVDGVFLITLYDLEVKILKLKHWAWKEIYHLIPSSFIKTKDTNSTSPYFTNRTTPVSGLPVNCSTQQFYICWTNIPNWVNIPELTLVWTCLLL